MPAPRHEIADLLDVDVPPGGTVITVSDLHLPPVRTDVSGRSCETLARRLDEHPGPLTVVLAGDVVELLGYPDATVTDILRAHEDLCVALTAVTARGGQVIYAIGNHDSDLAWDVKAADAVRDMTGARLCLSADLILDDGRKIRVEHGHQLDPYNCFHDPRNALDTPIGHHIVREVVPKIEWLGQGWVDGAHEMADPTDFPSFVGSRMVYRKLGRRLWWLIAIPLAILILLRIPVLSSIRTRYPDTDIWVHRGEILGYGAIADLVMLAVVVAILARRAWLSISALALDERGYGQNHAARQRAADLVADGYHGFISGHTHHPELAATAAGFYANSGSCTSVVEGIGGRFGLPPAYVRNQQICWVELDGGKGGAGLGPGRAARRDQDGALRRAGPQPALGHPRCASPPGRPVPTGPRRTRRPPARNPPRAIPSRSSFPRTTAPGPRHARPRTRPSPLWARSIAAQRLTRSGRLPATRRHHWSTRWIRFHALAIDGRVSGVRRPWLPRW